MSRFMIDHQITQAEKLKAFDYAGYGFDQSNSDENNWVFTRKQD